MEPNLWKSVLQALPVHHLHQLAMQADISFPGFRKGKLPSQKSLLLAQLQTFKTLEKLRSHKSRQNNAISSELQEVQQRSVSELKALIIERRLSLASVMLALLSSHEGEEKARELWEDESLRVFLLQESVKKKESDEVSVDVNIKVPLLLEGNEQEEKVSTKRLRKLEKKYEAVQKQLQMLKMQVEKREQEWEQEKVKLLQELNRLRKFESRARQLEEDMRQAIQERDNMVEELEKTKMNLALLREEYDRLLATSSERIVKLEEKNSQLKLQISNTSTDYLDNVAAQSQNGEASLSGNHYKALIALPRILLVGETSKTNIERIAPFSTARLISFESFVETVASDNLEGIDQIWILTYDLRFPAIRKIRRLAKGMEIIEIYSPQQLKEHLSSIKEM
jgi:hypothetical protein